MHTPAAPRLSSNNSGLLDVSSILVVRVAQESLSTTEYRAEQELGAEWSVQRKKGLMIFGGHLLVH